MLNKNLELGAWNNVRTFYATLPETYIVIVLMKKKSNDWREDATPVMLR